MRDKNNEIDLDIVGVLEGTDKSSSVSFSWDYLRHYQMLFAPWRNEPINLLEIGVERGPSLNVWRSFFGAAQIVGIDINPACGHLAGDRVAIEIGSQEDPGFLHAVCSKYPPTIIIDDGSHLAHHIVYSFHCLFPMLEPGGLYVVEDMDFHSDRHGDRWSGNKTVSVPDYFAGLARTCVLMDARSTKAWGTERYILDHIDSVSFIGGAVAIRKKAPRNLSLSLAYAERYLESITPTSAHYLRLAEYLLRHNGPLERAEQAVRTGIQSGGPSPELLRCLVDVQSRQGRVDEAAQIAADATKLWPNDHSTWERLSSVERQRGRIEESIVALERAALLNPGSAYYQDQLSALLQRQGEVGRALEASRRAAAINPSHEFYRRRVADLEQLAT